MLPTENRLRSSRDFTHVLREGRRAGRDFLVVHAARPANPDRSGGTRVGFIVGRGVGNSVTRHRVTRRLRAQVADRIDRIPPGTDLVVRALPRAARAESAVLGAQIDHMFARLFGPSERR